MLLMDRTVRDFTAKLATSSTAPGGGTISAVTGGFAAGLGAMVCQLTLGNGKYPGSQAVLPGLLEVLTARREELARLADEDAQAFDQVMAAFSLPKGTEAEDAARKEAIAKAYLLATDVPARTAAAAADVAKALVPLVQCGNQNALSDCGVAIECAHTAVKGALMSVLANLPGINNAAKAAEFTALKEALMQSAAESHRQGMALLREKLPV